jgi:hypothetical protein
VLAPGRQRFDRGAIRAHADANRAFRQFAEAQIAIGRTTDQVVAARFERVILSAEP